MRLPILGLLLLLGALLVSGCSSVYVMSHVPLSTLSRLSALKLAEIEPGDLRVAVRLPEQLEPRKGGVKVSIALSASGKLPASTEEFTLEVADEGREHAPLQPYRRSGARLWVYRLSDADVARLRSIVAQTSGAAGERRVSIAAGVDACHRAPLGAGPLSTTTFLRTSGAGYLVLTEDLNLRSVVPARELATKVPPCA